ncbi:hypothetical protein [Saccharococcus caldoxylosilyticus]|uniref:Yip1 domain-containing protein n=1 Tax=Parageobacillus caldoxylosilyticus NBRC 107762 TaxID=1220594 RepID=A0A023DD96_9BACL|nr:hypothetical protein [Parageobacillus caldoxylosilyticus]OQO99573.1 hypothetical protein BSK33_15020 [Geobacillus sp. 44B]MBB3852572.1 hypothetical protein [Parageobacillus caldoxylosilyticus]QNU38960.1 hypothetical protein IC801_07045 [Geobacillus sp. 44B]BDG37550.1 hypothetical protein PcaKH15_34560 [Parageobacillus caldoxylosilyticus]BDG41341.1 hypothetical protein PcaKH16_34800 [Parageobacillus caldoxylosilyticus]
MMYKSNPLKEILHPKIAFAQLREAERVKNVILVALLLLLMNVILSLLRAYFGIGTEELTKHLDRYTGEQFAFLQLLFAFGHALGGLCVPLLFLFISSIIYYLLFDIDFVKLLTIQLPILLIFLLEDLFLFPFQLCFGVKDLFSPFSLGVWGPYITKHAFIWALLRTVSLFSIWAISIQIIALRSLTEKSVQRIAMIVIAVYLFFALLAAAGTEFPFNGF